MASKNSVNKYLPKVENFLRSLDSNKEISTMADLKHVHPMDNRVYYWLRENGYFGLVKGVYKPFLFTITSKDVNNMVNFITKQRNKRSTKPKVTMDIKKFTKPALNGISVPKKEYDLVLNVKLVVTSIEYKL